MTEPLGVEFIKILPDASGFRAALQAQVASALPAAQAQIASAQAQLARTAQAPRGGAVTPGGVILPGSVRNAQELASAQNKVAEASTKSAAATRLSSREASVLGNVSRQTGKATQTMDRAITSAERNASRYTRGMIAATAASTGFFRAVSFASGAFLIGAAIGATIGAAVQEFQQMTRVGAQTAAILRATGEAARVTEQDIARLSRRQQELTGIDDEAVRAAANVILTFRGIRREGEGVNDVFGRSVKAVLDISNVLGTNLRSTAIQVGKALQDPAKGVTALRRAGITLSEAQRDLIKNLVATGRTLTAQKIVLAEIERQVGGTAEAIGRTLPGRLAILRERAKNVLGDYVKRISESQDASVLASQGALALNQAWSVLTATAQALGPPLVAVATGIGRATQAIGGAGVVIAAFAAYKAVTTAITLASAAQAAYTRTVLVGAGAITLQEAKLLSSVNAFNAQTAAALANTRVQVGNQRVQIGALGATSGAAAARVGLLRTATAALGGTVGIAAIAIGALVVGMIALARRAGPAAGSVEAVSKALGGLNTALERGQQIRDRVATTEEALTQAQLARRQAIKNLSAAEDRLNASRAEPGSIEQLALEDQLGVARQKVKDATAALATAELGYTKAVDAQNKSQKDRGFIVESTTKKLLAQARGVRAAIDAETAGLQFSAESAANDPALRALRQQALSEGLQRFVGQMNQLRQSANRADQVVGGALTGIASALDAIPTDKQITIAINLAGQGASIGRIFTEIGIGLANAQRQGQNAIEAARTAEANFAAEESARIQEAFRAAKAQLAIQTELARKAIEKRNAAKQEADQARENLRVAQESLRTAREAVSDARQALRDTVAAGRDSITQAVNDAKRNLRSIADSVAEALARIGQEGGGKLSDALAKRFRELRDRIVRGQGGPETQRAAQQVAAQAQALQDRGGGNDADRARRRLADLADQFNGGQISVREFNKRLNALLGEFHFNSAAFAREFGTAARNDLLAQIAGLREQAAASAAGPQRAGRGTAVDIVRPLDAVAKAQADTASATKDVQTAIHNLRESEQKVAAAAQEQRKAHTRLQTRIAVATEAINRRDAAQAEKDRAKPGNRPKPRGDAGDRTKDVTAAGASPR